MTLCDCYFVFRSPVRQSRPLVASYTPTPPQTEPHALGESFFTPNSAPPRRTRSASPAMMESTLTAVQAALNRRQLQVRRDSDENVNIVCLTYGIAYRSMTSVRSYPMPSKRLISSVASFAPRPTWLRPQRRIWRESVWRTTR